MGSSSLTCCAANSARCCSSSSPSMDTQSMVTILTLYIFPAISFLSLLFLLLSISRRFVKFICQDDDDLLSSLNLCLPRISENIRRLHQVKNPTRLSEPLLLELLPSNSPEWDRLFASADPSVDGSGSGDSGGKLKKKKRGKKKNKNKEIAVLGTGDLKLGDGGGELGGEDEKGELGLKKANKEDLVCLYPFTSSSSATQRKIKQHYDQLVKSHESKNLTLAEVGHFVNCLVDARKELHQKSEMIQRKFTITKGLLLRADKSSFDRLRKQLNKLELEQKRLEEDTFVYNLLQQQLKLSPAYKKIMDIGSSMEETKAKSVELTEDDDASFTDISFEEFLAQEKKDSFWQKRGKIRSPST